MISQIMNHTHLQQSLQTDILATQALLLDITGSAAELHSTIGDAQQAFENIMPFKNSMGLISWWPYCVIMLCAFSVFSPRFVANLAYIFRKWFSFRDLLNIVLTQIAIVIGMSLLCIGAFDWLRTVEKYALNSIKTASYLDVACFTLGFVMSALIIILVSTRGYSLVPTMWTMRYSRMTANDASESMTLP